MASPVVSMVPKRIPGKQHKSFTKQKIHDIQPYLDDTIPRMEPPLPDGTTAISMRKESVKRRSFVASKDRISDKRLIVSGKSVPNYLTTPMNARGYDSKMQFITLRFSNDQLEEVFRKHYRHYVLGKVQMGCIIAIVLHVIMGVLESLFGYSSPRESILLVARTILVVVTGVFYFITTRNFFQLHFQPLMMGYYLVHGILIVATSIAFESFPMDDATQMTMAIQEDYYFFYAGRWSQAISLIFISILFNASGMMFITATLCAWFYLALTIFVPFFFYSHRPELQNPQVVYGPILTCFCMLSAYNSERHIRREFVLRCNVTDDRKRREDLLETMLPAHIKENLKANRTDQLAEQFDEVSILFCYVSDFGRLSKTTPAIDLVQLMNRIFYCFDKATDSRGVYKVEAIAETYMCAAGVPIKDPHHHEKIADMALTMMYIQEQEKWQINGELIRLKIGIHSGPVVAGVIGSKTYSYHLFGDTVNTSSRVCSSSIPGMIQISERTHSLLTRSGNYEITPRGKVALKGKGELMLYWLDRKIEKHHGDTFGLSRRFNLAEDKTMTWTPKLKASTSDNVKFEVQALEMNKRTLAFQAKHVKRRPPTANSIERKMESAFIVDYNMANLTQFRHALQAAIGILIVAASLGAVTDHVQLGYAKWPSVYLNCTGIVLLATLYLYSYFRLFLSRMQTVAGFVIGLAITSLNINIVLSDKSNFLDLNIIYITLVSLLMRFRFVTSVAINSTILCMYLFFLVYSRHDFRNIVGFLCITIFCMVVGQYSCYRREIGLRADFLLKHTLNMEKKKCEELLANMLPSPQYAEALLLQGTIVDELEEVTLLYSDMVGFTALSANLQPVESCLFLNKVYSAFDKHLDSFGVYKMDTVGDAFIVIGGLPNFESEQNHAVAITAFAVEMLREMEYLRETEKVNLQMRIGIHTGKVVGGVVGIKKPRYLIWGNHTVIANSMESKSTPGRIQISESTYTMLQQSQSQFKCEPRGEISIGESESISTYFIETENAPTKESIIARYFSTPRVKNTIPDEKEENNLEQHLRDARKKNPFFQNIDLLGDGSRILHKLAEHRMTSFKTTS